MNQRKQRAEQMMGSTGYDSQVDHGKFEVCFRTNPKKSYFVSAIDNGLKCECKDHEIRKSKEKVATLTSHLELWTTPNYSYASITIQAK